MGYLKKIEYEIVPEKSLAVIRNCAGCGRKTYFKNTDKFRVNANGNKLDVWLIYQCENCKHTLNLSVYGRKNMASVPRKEYECFLANDEQTAENYGRDLQFFKRNKAEVDSQNVEYHIVKRQETEVIDECGRQVRIIIHNPHCLKIRPEKLIAEILGLSRSCVKKLLGQDEIKMEVVSPELIYVYVSNSTLIQTRG